VSIFFVGVDDDFRIAICTENVPTRLEIVAQLLEVIDLPVENDPDRPVFIAHRLVGNCTEIDDRQATVAKPDVSAAPYAFTVRTTMSQRGGHAPKVLRVNVTVQVKVELPANTTHTEHDSEL
jgi:hypothetical protein